MDDVSTPLTRHVRAQVRAAILLELSFRGLDKPEPLAEALGKVPAVAETILQRTEWPIEHSLWIIEKLDLPLTLKVEQTYIRKDAHQ